MTGSSSIEWTQATWNPTTGCDRLSAGCDHCYALTMAKRLKGMGAAAYQTDGDPRTSGPGFGVAVHRDRLDDPLRWAKPRLVFVNSMSDLFHDDVPAEFIADCFAVMALAGQHTFQVLTKRHGRMRSLLRSPEFRLEVDEASCRRFGDLRPPSQPRHLDLERGGVVWPIPNLWLGVSVEDQKWADIRIPALLDTPAAVRFLSCEPLLGPVDLDRYLRCWTCGGAGVVRHEAQTGGVPAQQSPCPDCSGFEALGADWVIAGGESGPGARPMQAEWARTLRKQCGDAGVPFFFKQAGAVLGREWGCTDRKGHNPDEWPEPFPRQMPAAAAVRA